MSPHALWSGAAVFAPTAEEPVVFDFGPEGTPAAEGIRVGLEPFDPERGFGWENPPDLVRERGGWPGDPALETLVLKSDRHSGEAVFRVAVEPGLYSVRATTADAEFPAAGRFALGAEPRPWFEQEVPRGEVLVREGVVDARGGELVLRMLPVRPGGPFTGLNRLEVLPAVEANLTGAEVIWRHGIDPFNRALLRLPTGKVKLRLRFDAGSVDPSLPVWLAMAGETTWEAWLNGERVAYGENWKHPVTAPVRLKPGWNEWLVEAENIADAPKLAGVVGRLFRVEPDGDERTVAVTDGEWESFDGEAWQPATVIGPVWMSPFGQRLPYDRVIPDDFPRFMAPGVTARLDSMRDIYHLFHQTTATVSTLWDQWLTEALVRADPDFEAKKAKARGRMLAREMTDDGYVSTYQHRGMAHDLGWPFPGWTQTKGWGWHASVQGNPYGRRLGYLLREDLADFTTHGMTVTGYDPMRGVSAAVEPGAYFETEDFEVGAISCAFVRFEWYAEGLDEARPYLEWKTEADPEYGADRRLYFEPAESGAGERISMIPLYEATDNDEVLTGFRIGFGNSEPGTVILKGLMTAPDSRHNVNNAAFVQGAVDYAAWTGDLGFLAEQLPRMRKAMAFAIEEFSLRDGAATSPWRGHEGDSGVVYDEDGNKVILHGRGIGDNYWDLLPFGGHDTLATAYYYDALLDLAGLEEQIAAHPEWGLPTGGIPPEELREIAAGLKENARKNFWNPETGRFAANRDLFGNLHDYGYTFVNQEAIHYGLADAEAARTIMDWIDGRRLVEADTSTGADIYRWRFGPRSSTLRNLDYYMSVWSQPERRPFGEQVQDGGAVLGFSYFDLMSRLKVYGPDDAWERLGEIIDWWEEIQLAGGVRAFYEADPENRGFLQGGGTAGGLGIDAEFRESILLPQFLVDGFLGLDARLDGLRIDPAIPTDWPRFAVKNIRYQDGLYDFTVTEGEIVVETLREGSGPGTTIAGPDGTTRPLPSAGGSVALDR